MRHVINRISDRDALAAAALTSRQLRKFFNWCFEHEKIEVSTVSRIKTMGSVSSRDWVLNSVEISFVRDAFRSEEALFGRLLELLLSPGNGGLRWQACGGMS